MAVELALYVQPLIETWIEALGRDLGRGPR